MIPNFKYRLKSQLDPTCQTWTHMVTTLSVRVPVHLSFRISCPGHNSETTIGISKKVCRQKDLIEQKCSQCTRTVEQFALPSFGVIALVHFYALDYVRDIILKLQEISTRNLVGRYISFSRCAVHKNRNSALPNFEVIALRSFLDFDLCPGNNSKTIRKKLCRRIYLIEQKCSTQKL